MYLGINESMISNYNLNTISLISKFKLRNIQSGPRKSTRLSFCTCPCYCINFCIYAILWTGANFSWPICIISELKYPEGEPRKSSPPSVLHVSLLLY